MMQGLNTTEAQASLLKYGPNAIPEEKPRLILVLLKKLWGPVPWMLEASIVLELMIGRYTQAAILGILLIFNAVISFLQENKAQNALALLQKRLIVKVRVLRDNNWQILSSKELVPGDIVHLRMGDLIPADLILIDGYLSVDQSALTGESLPVEIGPKETVYAGGIIQRGEATGKITATGINTYYGKTAELVHVAKTVSHLETTIVGLVKYLIILDSVLVACVLIYSRINAIPFTEAVPFALMLLVASVPVALPATFTLASALGAQELANQGILVTRLSAIEEAAAMDVLCIDKTGTITKNQLVVSAIYPFASNKEDEILRMAALGSDESSQDPIDLAIIKAAREGGLYEETQKLHFNPFDPSTKYTEAIVQTGQRTLRIIKGYPQNIADLVHNGLSIDEDVERLADKGYRVIAIAIGEEEHLELAGLIGLYDPPREDSKSLIRNLQELSIRIVMITGDSLATARAIAAQVGLGNIVCQADKIRQGLNDHVFDCDVVAGVLPEDKYHVVQRFQQAGHVVGMTGDGVNDAPALKQAEVGIAMANAIDVAKFAASAILSNPGLSDILSTIKTGRQIYRRMLTYTYNKVIKTFQIGLFLSLGLLLTGVFVTTPRLVVLLLFANDFITMSLASDQVSYSRKPERWAIKPLVIVSLTMAFAWLVFSFAIFFLGRDIYQLNLAQLQTLVFAMLVFTGQANIYLIREQHGHFWKSRPGKALILSTIVDISAVILLTTQGILMTPISIDLIGALIGSVIIYTFGLDLLKLRLFS